jgi:hypothetical protein
MHIPTIRSARSLGIPDDRAPWRSTLRSILNNRSQKKVGEPTQDSLHRVDDRLLADIGLYREQRLRQPGNRTDRQAGSTVPVALLAIWMPRI